MFKQIELKYEFNALEPHIDETTMVTHYTSTMQLIPTTSTLRLKKRRSLPGNPSRTF